MGYVSACRQFFTSVGRFFNIGLPGFGGDYLDNEALTRRNTSRDEAWIRQRMAHRTKGKRGRPRGGGEKRCGTRYMYGLGCRCDPCTAANREYGRRYRLTNTRMAKPKPQDDLRSLTVDSIELMRRYVWLYHDFAREAYTLG